MVSYGESDEGVIDGSLPPARGSQQLLRGASDLMQHFRCASALEARIRPPRTPASVEMLSWFGDGKPRQITWGRVSLSWKERPPSLDVVRARLPRSASGTLLLGRHSKELRCLELIQLPSPSACLDKDPSFCQFTFPAPHDRLHHTHDGGQGSDRLHH